MVEYSSPVDKLLSRGEPKPGFVWTDYRTLGLGSEQVAELIRMATDPALNLADGNTPLVWAPLHAWRALGQLGAVDAVGPLLELSRQLDDEKNEPDDWLMSDLPKVFGGMGPAAVPVLTAYVADRSHGLHSRMLAAEGLKNIALAHPETRDECVCLFTRLMESATANDPAFNGWVLGYLLDLNAVEAAPVLERAFAADAVDESIAGGWEEAQWELGLTDEPPERRAFDFHLPNIAPGISGDFRVIERPPRDHQAKAKAKAKRKQAAKSRKRNRKHH